MTDKIASHSSELIINKDHNQNSGNTKKTYVYEKELEEIFGNKPNVTPVCTISSAESSNNGSTDAQESDLDGKEVQDTVIDQARKEKSEAVQIKKVRKNIK